MLNTTQLEILVYVLFGVAVFGIAYILKKYKELSDHIIDEKLTALNYLIPVLEQVVPTLPDKYQSEAQFILDLMKEMKSLNEAIKNIPATARLKAWRNYKKILETKLKIYRTFVAG